MLLTKFRPPTRSSLLSSSVVCSLSRYLLALDDPLEHLDRDLGLTFCRSRHRPRRRPFSCPLPLLPGVSTLLPGVTRSSQMWPAVARRVLAGLHHRHHHERVYGRGAPLGRRLGRSGHGRGRPLPLLPRPALDGGEAPPLPVDPVLEHAVVDELVVLLVGGGGGGGVGVGGGCVVFRGRGDRAAGGGEREREMIALRVNKSGKFRGTLRSLCYRELDQD